MRAVCHICSAAFETNEVLSSPLMFVGPQLPPVVDGIEAKHITQVMFVVVYRAQVMVVKINFLESKMYVTVWFVGQWMYVGIFLFKSINCWIVCV